MRTYTITLTGKMPMLQHSDNIEWADRMDEWRSAPENKARSKAGDDRTPAFRWLGALYHDDNVIAVPQDSLMRSFMEGGAMVPVPGGRGNKTFKSQTQSGMLINEMFWPLLVKGKSIPIAPIKKLEKEPSFAAHLAAVRGMGFDLHVKRARIGTSKHIRVRPVFHNWSTVGTITVWDEQITTKTLTQIIEYAGLYKGLGDWRPGGKTPGPYGMFAAEVREQ